MLLKKGDKGLQVTYLQYALHIMCCTPGGFDGSFGAGTEAAVRKYQNKYGLSVDGQVGDATWNNLVGEIKIIQRALSNKKYYSSYIDGIAGEGTYNAVVKFQKDHGLSVDGQVGDSTRAKLMGGTSSGSGTSGFPLKQGSSGDNVLYLQYGLHIMCCSPGGIDGDFGSGTETAVRKFQGKYSLSADGIVGTGTWSKLQSLIKEIQNSLSKKGYNTNGVDGLAGPATYEAVINFQRANGLMVDGQVGPATREKLLGSSGDGGSDSFPLKVGSKGPYVLFLQNGLWISCINPNGRDGDFGNGTASAVRLFQSNHGLSVDGIVGTATWEKLRSVIRPIQQALVNHGYNTGGVDGIAGDKTYNAVIAFQKAKGLTADGMVGNATKAKLGITGNSGGSGTTSATLRVGSNGSLTRYLQRMLNVLGYPMSVDGSFGETTKNAIINFQSKRGLTADGVVGSATWKELFSAYKVPVSGTGVQKMVNVAKHELEWGFREDNSNNITPYGEWYGIQGGAWCAMFVSWCAKQAGILGSKVPSFAYCPFGVNAYRSKGKFYSRGGGYTPKPGDTIFFWNSVDRVVGHTGIVISVTSSTVTTIEGNASDAVMQKTYSRSNTYIHGYGCNDGIITPTQPTIEEINNAISYKWAKLIEAAGYKTLLLNLSAENFNKEFFLHRDSYYMVSTEISADTDLYDSSTNRMRFNAVNGDISFEGTGALYAFETTFSGIDMKNFSLDPIPKIAFALGNGNGKTEIAIEGDWLIYSYVYEGEVEVTETFKQKFSYKFNFYIKPVPPEEGGAFVTQKQWETATAVLNTVTGITIIGVAVYALASSGIIASVAAAAGSVIAFIIDFFYKLFSALKI